MSTEQPLTARSAPAASRDDAARERAVATAADLFYARGIQAVGMDDLRRESGLSLKKLYSLFASKEDIVLAVLAARHEEWTVGLAARADAADSPTDKLLAIYDYLADWFTEDTFRGCTFINAFGELGSESPRVAELAREHKASFQRYVAGLVEAAGASPALGPQLSILAEGAQTTAAIAHSDEAALHARQAAEILIAAAMR